MSEKSDYRSAMEQELRAHLLACVEAYSASTGEPKTKIAQAAASDRSFFTRIETGGFTVKKYDEVIGWFSDHWPAAVIWPAGVPRPKAVATAG